MSAFARPNGPAAAVKSGSAPNGVTVHRLADDRSCANPSLRWREHIAALVAGRLAYLFATQPGIDRYTVYRGPSGSLMVREPERVPPHREVLGVYSRDVTIAQIVDDLADQ